MADAGIAVRWESVRRPENLRFAVLQGGYEQKLRRAYAWLEQELDFDDPLHIGHVALATTLDWLEFRGLPAFRDQERLSGWLDSFRKRESMRATPLHGDTHD